MSRLLSFFINDVFLDSGGHYWTVLRVARPYVYLIELKKAKAWPITALWVDVAGGAYGKPVQYPHPGVHVSGLPEEAWIAATKKLDVVEGLLANGPKLFDPRKRMRLIKEHAAVVNISATTIYKYLHAYFTGGQSKYALLHKSYLHPSVRAVGETGNRGRPPRRKRPIYQMRLQDNKVILRWIKRDYLTSKSNSLRATYNRYLHKHWRVDRDGNGDFKKITEGHYPSFRQFKSVIKGHTTAYIRMQLRNGTKRAASMDGSAAGSVDEDAVGVGHTYEIDATILDLYIVCRRNRLFIIGKATLYLIIDSVSRLIVGFHLCLYKPSWDGAVQAILSIAEDKKALCERYKKYVKGAKVKYDPNDWPAHEIFPERFFGDHGEMFSANSNRIPGIEIAVTNPPSWTPQAKPVVESRFHLIQMKLAPSAPGYQPPMEATMRGGKKFEKDGCLNIDEATAAMLGLIILHNKTTILNPKMTEAIVDGVSPVPLKVWNHGIKTTAGLLRRYSWDFIWRSLMPTGIAKPTHKGLKFKGLHYTCDHAERLSWFNKSSTAKPVTVTYQSRLVDKIWIHYGAELIEATLIETVFAGMAFPNAEAILIKVRDMISEHAANDSLLAQFEYQDLIDAIVTPAKAEAKQASGGNPKKTKSKESQLHRLLDDRELTTEAEIRREERMKKPTVPKSPRPSPKLRVVASDGVIKASETPEPQQGNAGPAEPLDKLDQALQETPGDWI